MNREDLAWVAGVFEGEGCFSFHEKSRAISACISMTDLDVIETVKSIIGLGTIVSVKPGKVGWKPQWKWAVNSFEDVQAVAAMLWPWLKSRRRVKIKSVLKGFIGGVPKSVIISKIRTEKIREALKDTSRCQADIAYHFGVCPARVTQIKQELR